MSAKKYLTPEEHPLLFKEIDPSSGIDLTQWTIYKDETIDKNYPKLPWICSECSHSWVATLPNRIRHKSGCPKCSIKKQTTTFRKNKINKNGSFLDKCSLAGIYWSKINKDSPSDYPAYAKDIKQFECPYCLYSWSKPICDFVTSKGCPECTKNLYEQETRWRSELQYLGFSVQFRAKIDGYECDIYLPELNLGIEIDGFNHDKKDKIIYDIKKQIHFKEIGLNFIRFRDKKLNLLDDVLQVFYSQNKSLLKPIMETIKLILDNFNFSLEHTQVLQKYLNDNKFVGDELYNKIYSERIAPNNLLDFAPEIAKEFSEMNLPITAKNVSVSTAKKYFWTCKNGHKDYSQSVASRTGRQKSGCPLCAKGTTCVDINNSISTTHKNLIEKFYDYELNNPSLIIKTEDCSYINLRAGSNEEIYVKCEKNCSFKIKTCHLIRANENIKSFKCKNKNCKHLNTKPEEN
jgi:very-short-patch-repair endonuclease